MRQAALIITVLFLVPGPAASQDTEALYQRACDDGDLIACNVFGLMLESGAEVPEDLPRAAGLFERACEGGLSAGCANLALMYEAGLGVGQDLGRARELYDEACSGGDEFSCDLAADLGTEGDLAGTVTETNGRPLSDVQITITGRGASALTNRRGRFMLEGIQPGPVEVRLDRLGYASRSVSLSIRPGTTVELRATMDVEAIELEPIRVSVRSPWLELNGFYRRAEDGTGSHFTAEDLVAVDAKEVSEFLRGRVPGLSVQSHEEFPFQVAMSRRGVNLGRGGCVLPIYLDGVQLFEPDLDRLEPESIEGIEVYTGVAGVPIRFGGNTCGLVLLWSRTGN